jgi:hypothetical protein
MKRLGLKRVYLTQTEIVSAEKALEFCLEFEKTMMIETYKNQAATDGIENIRDAHAMFKSFAKAGRDGHLPGPPDSDEETVYPYGRRVWVQLTTIAISLTGILGLTIAGYFV